MALQSDKNIKALLQQTPQVIQKFPHKDGWADLPLTNPRWDSSSSPIQPCSVDLHIGLIFTPGAKVGSLGSPENGHTSLRLEAGQSVVVMSHERLELPENIAAIALPPSRISSAGILIANFGHIDPGYQGHLRFTIINMGKDEYALSQGEMIITLLLFEVSDVGVPFDRRQPLVQRPDRPSRSEVDALANDFANVAERAKAIAQAEVGGSGMRHAIQTVFIPAVVGMVFGAIFGLGGYWLSIKIDLSQEIKQIHALQAKWEGMAEKHEALARDLRKIEEANKFLIERLIQK